MEDIGRSCLAGAIFYPSFFLLLVSGSIWKPVLACDGAEYIYLLAYIPGIELFAFIAFVSALEKKNHQESQPTKKYWSYFL